MSYLVRKFSHYDLCNVLNNDNKIAKVSVEKNTKYSNVYHRNAGGTAVSYNILICFFVVWILIFYRHYRQYWTITQQDKIYWQIIR